MGMKMKVLTVLIPTLGRSTLNVPLFNLSSWIAQIDPKDRDLIDFVIYHNKNGSISKEIKSSSFELLNELNFRIIEGEIFQDGAELSLRAALNFVHTQYCLPISDDNSLNIEALNLALEYAKTGKYSWVHFNSQVVIEGKNTRPNLNLYGSTYVSNAKQLLTRIGLNYSICNVSRSLFDLNMLNLELWDSQINAKKDNYSFSFTLLASMKHNDVLIVNHPLQIYSSHKYDTDGQSWINQWSKHGERRGYFPLSDFTIHLTQMHQTLIEIGVCKRSDLQFAVVSENEILRPLATEMIWHSINQLVYAHSKRNYQIDFHQWESHCDFLALTFPIFGHIIEMLRIEKNEKIHLPSMQTLEIARQLMLQIETSNKIGSLFLLGNSVGNYLNHPDGVYEILDEKLDARTILKYLDFVSDNQTSRFHSNAKTFSEFSTSKDQVDHFYPMGVELSVTGGSAAERLVSKLRAMYLRLPRIIRKPALMIAKKLLG